MDVAQGPTVPTSLAPLCGHFFNGLLAAHDGPESCADGGNPIGEGLTGVRAGWVSRREIHAPVRECWVLRGADAVEVRRRPHRLRRQRQAQRDPARSETPCTHGNTSHGSPEIPRSSAAEGAADRIGKRDRPGATDVGANLQDHPVSPLTFRVRGTDTFKNAESPLDLIRYLALRRGMLASNGAEAIAVVQTQPGAVSAPASRSSSCPSSGATRRWSRRRSMRAPWPPQSSLPVRGGRVSLCSGEPAAAPLIDFKLLSDPDGFDASALLSGARLARRIAATPPLALEIVDELRPGASVESDVDLLRAPGGGAADRLPPRGHVPNGFRSTGLGRSQVAGSGHGAAMGGRCVCRANGATRPPQRCGGDDRGTRC